MAVKLKELLGNKFQTLPDICKGLVSSQQESYESYEKEWIRASQAFNICPRQFVINYWKPAEKKESVDFESRLRMDIGTYLHSYYQNKILGPAQILYGFWKNGEEIHQGYQPDPHWEYVEATVKDEVLRLSGHVDGIICGNRIEFLYSKLKNIDFSDKTWRSIFDTFDSPEDRALFELKTCNNWVMDALVGPSSIAGYYRLQATIYQKLSGYNKTVFVYLNRDTLKKRVLVYTGEQSLWDDLVKKAEVIWDCIKNRKLPTADLPCKTIKDKRAKQCGASGDCFNVMFNHGPDKQKRFEAWVEKQIALQPNRKFLFQ